MKLRRSINLSTPMPQTVVAYGARLLNRRTIGRTTQDPCAEDFHWLSPYSVCGSDPINNVDLNGKKITTIIGNQIYEYINGDDGCGFYKNGKKYEGSNNFVTALLEALAKLQSAPVGSALVESVVDSKKSVNIEEGKENAWSSSRMTLYWNPKEWLYYTVVYDNNKSTSMGCKPFIALAHEMFHAEDTLSGYKNEVWSETSSGEKYYTTEKWAIYGENFIRFEHGMDFRLGYIELIRRTPTIWNSVKHPLYPDYNKNKILFGCPKGILYQLNYRKTHR